MAELPVLAPVTGRGVKPAGRRGRGGERRRWTVPWRRPRPRRAMGRDGVLSGWWPGVGATSADHVLRPDPPLHGFPA